MMIFETGLQRFFLIFTRIAMIFLISPIFSSQAIRPIVRGSLVFFITLAIYPNIQYYNQPIDDAGTFIMMIILEALEGFLIGLIVLTLFSIFQTAGQFFALQMGFSAAQVYDITNENELPILGQFLNIIAIEVFLSSDIFYRFLLQGVIDSFRKIPVPQVIFTHHEHLLNTIITILNNSFKQALFIALPIISILFLLSITMGLLGKATPQMNLLVLGFPLQIGIGFIIIILIMPFLIPKIYEILVFGVENITKALVIVVNKE